MSRTVTAGIDGSRESLAAADWAAGEATARGRLLRLVYIWKEDEASSVAYYGDPDKKRRAAEALLHKAVEYLRPLHPHVRIETTQMSGAPVEELRAAGERAELLVLGSRGLGGLKGFILGSVSLAVLARVPCPLVLVRSGSVGEVGPSLEDDKETSTSRGKDVVVGLDLPEPSQEVLAFAFAAADRYGCGLRVVHSWTLPPVYGPGMADVVPVLLEATATERRKEMDAALAPWVKRYPGTDVSRQCLQGHPAQDMVETAAQTSLVVVGLRRRSARVGSHIGPVVHSVLHHAAGPVAVVPHS
jgi:nucleotide-binding universal stress UspA family protein